MDAFIFTLGLFLYWGLIGFSTLSVFPARLRIVQGVLISPAIGVAVTILPVFFINRAGIPVKDFGGMLFYTLAIFAVITLLAKRPPCPAKRLLPHAAILIAGLLLVSFPMFRYGFDWLSYCNDDMANYCLGAQRFFNHGFFDKPDLDALASGREYSLAYWFFHVARGVRPGSELMLSFVWSFSGLNAHQVFMPVIMALHLSLIAAAGSMVAGFGDAKKTPLIAMALLAVSPLTTFGALYQLIGQVGGLALLCAAITLIYRARALRPIRRHVVGAIPAVVCFSALIVWYPEVLPFLGLGWLVYIGLLYKSSQGQIWRVAVPTFIVGGLVLLLMNEYLVKAVLFLLHQASHGMKAADLSTILFPFYLAPSGLPIFLGLRPISIIREPYASLSIVGGVILFYWLLRWVVPSQVKRAIAPASMFIFMFAMGLLLFYRNNDFGLYKLAMYAQPFLAAILAIKFASDKPRANKYSAIRYIFPVFLVPIIISQFSYVRNSIGDTSGGLTEIPHASKNRINSELKASISAIPELHSKEAVLVSSAINVVQAKFQALYTEGIATMFPARNFFTKISSVDEGKKYTGTMPKKSSYIRRSIMDNNFEAIEPSRYNNKTLWYLDSGFKADIFNTFAHESSSRGYFIKKNAFPNLLVFVHSELGNHYYLGNRNRIAFYQLEKDPLFPGQMFSSLGKNLLFMVVNPTSKPRVVMELTDTVVKQHESRLPTPRVQDTELGFVGRGSGRVFSSPIVPTVIDGMSYLSIDMQRDGRQFPKRVSGLSMLYGREVPQDSRYVTAFGRDISLVSEEQYQAIKPPARLQHFPDDLADKNLEYSGIYEDGWISEQAFFVFAKEHSSDSIFIRGMVPQIDKADFSTTLHIKVDGVELATKKMGLGAFEVKVPTGQMPVGRHRVDLTFDAYQTLPTGDDRIIGGKLEFLGFKQD